MTMPQPPLASMLVPTQYLDVGAAIVKARGVEAASYYRLFGLDPGTDMALPTHVTAEDIRRGASAFIRFALPGRPASLQFLEHFPITAHGPAGMLMLNVATLGDALDAALRYGPLLLPFLHMTRQEHASEVHFVHELRGDFGAVADFMMELALLSPLTLLPFLVRSPGEIRVHLRHGPPPNFEAFAAAFPARFEFAANANRLILHRADLAIATIAHSPTNCHRLRQVLDVQPGLLGKEGQITTRLRLLIQRAMAEHATITAASLAERLSMSTRTLNRRLRAEGTTIPRFLNQLRIEQAQRLLRESGKSVASIGYLVGFADLPRFSRVFKQLTGLSPTAYRAAPPGYSRTINSSEPAHSSSQPASG